MNGMRDAIIKALVNCDAWACGAVVVMDGSGYDAIPGACLSDIGYTGSRRAVWRIADQKEIFGRYGKLTDYDEDELNDLLNDIIAQIGDEEMVGCPQCAGTGAMWHKAGPMAGSKLSEVFVTEARDLCDGVGMVSARVFREWEYEQKFAGESDQ